MKASVNEHEDKEKEKVMSVTGENPYDIEFHDDDVQKHKGKEVDVNKRRRDKKKGFGRKIALINSKSPRPDEWWRIFGHDAPNLQKIHTKKRNRLERERLTDLLYVHYNLRLQNRLGSKKRSYDPIDYECIDKVEFWVIDENPEEELDYEELEEMLDEEQAKGDEDVAMRINDEDIDLSKFGDGDCGSTSSSSSSSSSSDEFNDLSHMTLRK
ncbi:hypothetical protein AAHA92_01667 [Salvia divinorum]|uniref:Uncharacterized protein n=1 Tax=Salvia divinorum TaxID=28513 RepID=A0ABD1IDU9_SALDI